MQRLLVVALAIGAGTGTAAALPSFQSPSRNVGCIGDRLAGRFELRCDIASTATPPPPRPRSCQEDWAGAYVVSARGRPRAICHGDTALRAGPVLGYGRSWLYGPFRCSSRRAGVTCTNRGGHGMFLSRERVRLF